MSTHNILIFCGVGGEISTKMDGKKSLNLELWL